MEPRHDSPGSSGTPPLAGMAKRLAAIAPHKFTPETSRKYRSKALAARLRNRDKRALERAMANTKCGRLPITGRHVVRLLSEALANQEALTAKVAALEAQVRRLSVQPGPRTQRPRAAPVRAGAEPPPTPPPDEPSMVEPCWPDSCPVSQPGPADQAVPPA